MTTMESVISNEIVATMENMTTRESPSDLDQVVIQAVCIHSDILMMENVTTVKHLLFPWPYFREAVTHDLFTRLNIRDLPYLLLLSLHKELLVRTLFSRLYDLANLRENKVLANKKYFTVPWKVWLQWSDQLSPGYNSWKVWLQWSDQLSPGYNSWKVWLQWSDQLSPGYNSGSMHSFRYLNGITSSGYHAPTSSFECITDLKQYYYQ